MSTSSGITQKLCDVYTEGVRKALHNQDGRVANAALDATDICPIDAVLISEIFLADAGLFS